MIANQGQIFYRMTKTTIILALVIGLIVGYIVYQEIKDDEIKEVE